jgi:hypothetical protein
VSNSFWQQDVNWSVQQRSWTRSFHQVNQNWTQKLSRGNSPDSTTPAAQTDQAGSASIINPSALAARVESSLASTSQPGSINNSASKSSAATSRGRLDVLA